LFTSLQIKFLIFIAIVFIITVGFTILIWRQMKIVGKKALAAKQRQKEYQNQLDDDQKEDTGE
jgi:hypothetical protein